MASFKFEQRKTTNIFLNIFLPFFLCIILSFFALSSILYFNFENIALKQVTNFQKNDLKSVSHSLSNMLDSARALSVQAYFDSDITNLLYYEDLEPEAYRKAQLRMVTFKNSNPFLYSISVFKGNHIYIEPSDKNEYDQNSVADKNILNIITDMKRYPSHSLIPRKLKDDINNSKTPQYVYSYLFYDSQLQNGTTNEGIILNISEDWLRASIDSFKNNDTRIFIIDRDGNLVINDTKYPMLTNLSGSPYIQKILAAQGPSGYFRADADGVDSLITSVKTDIFGYTFVSVTPYTEVVGEIRFMKKITYLIVSILTLIAIIVTLILSRRLYNPIQSILQKLSSYKSETRNILLSRKQEYLKSLVKESQFLNPEKLQEKFAEFNLNIAFTSERLLLLLKIDHFHDFSDLYNLGDRNLIKFALMNISNEVSSRYFPNECIDMGEDHILLLMDYSYSESPRDNNKLLEVIHLIQENILNYLKLSISVNVGEIFDDLYLLNAEYSKVLASSYSRMTLGHKSLSFTEQMEQPPFTNFKYPVDKEKQIIELLKLGHEKEAQGILSGLLESVLVYGEAVLNMTILHFVMTLTHTLETQFRPNDLVVDDNVSTLMNKLNRLETLDEIKLVFFDIFQKLCSQEEQAIDLKHKKLLNTVIEIIEREYASQNVSLETISARLDITPSYLGRLFKKYKAQSIVDYINWVRIEQAKELLVSTSHPINTIMELTGFTSRSHFYSLFKKTYGFSPGNLKFNNAIDQSKD